MGVLLAASAGVAFNDDRARSWSRVEGEVLGEVRQDILRPAVRINRGWLTAIIEKQTEKG